MVYYIAFGRRFHIIKLDSNFNVVWENFTSDYAESIIEDSQGNFFNFRGSESINGNIEHNNGKFDIFF
jgi:hypothetical protein